MFAKCLLALSGDGLVRLAGTLPGTAFSSLTFAADFKKSIPKAFGIDVSDISTQ